MTSLWNAGSHAVQFYENESFVHHVIAEFFTQGADPRDPLILVSRPRTFTAVAERLAADRYSAVIDTADRIQFIDAEAVLSLIMDGEILRPERADRLFTDVLSQARPSHAQGTIRLYGEFVDMLCQHGHHATALQLEGIANMLLDLKPRLSILCGYAVERFKDDTNAAQFREVCQKHTHVIPPGGLSTAFCTNDDQAVTLQHNVFNHMLARQPPPWLRTCDAATPAPTIYVIDDNATLRRALGRLLTSSDWPVRTFDTAEAFLAELDKLSRGCLVIDVQLPRMSGLDLIRQLTDMGLSWPIVVMSGLHDKKSENEALLLGARAYLRKPFNSESLLDAIARALL